MESLIQGSWESINKVDLAIKKRVMVKFENEKTVTEVTTVLLKRCTYWGRLGDQGVDQNLDSQFKWDEAALSHNLRDLLAFFSSLYKWKCSGELGVMNERTYFLHLWTHQFTRADVGVAKLFNKFLALSALSWCGST